MFAVEEDEVGCEFGLECATVAGLPRPPRPTTAQLTSIPDFIDQSQTRPRMGVLTRTFKTGKRSGYRAGGLMANSSRWRPMQAAEATYRRRGEFSNSASNETSESLTRDMNWIKVFGGLNGVYPKATFHKTVNATY